MDSGTVSRETATPRSSTSTHRRRSVAASSHAINLALQGGGAHGAFTWGVLDRLLEDERLSFEGISATSAGAMNATVCSYGLAEGGRDGAKTALAAFWRRVSHAASFSPLQPSLMDRVTGNRNLEWSPAFLALDLVSRLLSPYQFNPFNINPLREALAQSVDFDVLRGPRCKVRLFLTATNVETGKIKVFENAEIGLDAVLASGCLPFLFQAVEIDGQHYWDGGYMGNPAIFPLIYHCEARDVVIVHVNPMNRPHVPHTAMEILNRINEISFNSSLMREMRAISFVTRLIEDGELDSDNMKQMLIHEISAEEVMADLSVSSKLNADWEFLTDLRDVGRARAEAWIEAHFDDLGRSSTVDIRAKYL